MPIPNNESDSDKGLFYTDRYKTLVRSEKEILLRGASVVPFTDMSMVYAFRTDFYRLLRVMKVPAHLRWTVAYLNDVIDPNQDISGMRSFLQVDETDLYKAIARNNTTQG